MSNLWLEDMNTWRNLDAYDGVHLRTPHDVQHLQTTASWPRLALLEYGVGNDEEYICSKDFNSGSVKWGKTCHYHWDN